MFKKCGFITFCREWGWRERGATHSESYFLNFRKH